MKKTLLTLALLAASATSAQADLKFDALAASFQQETANSKYFSNEIALPPGFSQDNFAALNKVVAASPRYSKYSFNKLDYIKDYAGTGSDLVVLYGAEIVVLSKNGNSFKIESAQAGNDGLNNSSKFYNVNNHYFILQGLSDKDNFSEYRLLKLDGYKISQVGANIVSKGTDLPPAAEVSLSLNPQSQEPRVVFLEPQVWLELGGKTGNYKQTSQDRVTLELQSGKWNLISGQRA